MKYTPRAYAEAYLGAVDAGTEGGVATARLASLIEKNGDRARASQIAHEVERMVTARGGGRMVRVEFARIPEPRHAEKVLSQFDPRDRVSTAINPRLVAGVRIIKDGEHELDVSLAGKLDALFKRS